MGHQGLIDLIKSNNLTAKSEEQIFESVLAWIRFDVTNRHQYVAEVMANIRFPLMRKDYLESHVQTEPLIKDSSQCMDHVSAAYQYHLSKDHPNRQTYLVFAGVPFNSFQLRDLNYQSHQRDKNRQYTRASMPRNLEKYVIIFLMCSNQLFANTNDQV